MAVRRYNKADPETCRKKKWREAEDEPLYKPSIFLYLFLRLKIYDISSIPNVQRGSDHILKIRQYIRYQNKTYIYRTQSKKICVGPLCPTIPMTWLIVPHCLAPPVGYNERFCNFSAITFLICLKCFCNIYCKCIVCPKVYIV